MTIHFERTLKIDATPDAVWAVFSSFMHIDEFAPEIESVDALTDGEDGIGSRRRNHFHHGLAQYPTEGAELHAIIHVPNDHRPSVIRRLNRHRRIGFVERH